MKGKDVVNALYKAMSENPGKKMSELFDVARKKEAPRFYVSFDKARRYVSMLDRGLELPLVNKNKRAMYKELRCRLKMARGDKARRYQLLNDIINSPAPEFYMDYETFKKTFYRAVKSKK